MRYRRVQRTGVTYFFTVNLANRQSDLLVREIAALREVNGLLRKVALSLSNARSTAAKRNELHTFAVIPKRWVVERSFAWLEKCRRLWKNCEGLINTSLQMVVLALLTLLLKRL